MPSPIKPSQWCAAAPTLHADFCAKFKAIIQVFGYLCSLFTWMFNEDGTVTEEFKSTASDLSPGDLKWSASAVATMGWLYCNGQEVSRTTHAPLFAVIGTTYGAGDGSTTFGIPDMRGYFMMGVSASYAAGTTGGSATVTLTQPQMPAHHHSVTGRSKGGGTGSGTGEIIFDDDWDGGQKTKNTDSKGEDEAHPNLPPYKPFYCYIRY